nr:helix-turn-helix domain protein [uncultured bacterium]
MQKQRPVLDIATLTALAESNRLHIVELLRNGPLTVGEIADRLGLRQPQASKHLKVLSESGILEVRAEANRRVYTLRSAPFQLMEAWLKSFPKAMEERFDKLEEYLQEIQSKKKT